MDFLSSLFNRNNDAAAQRTPLLPKNGESLAEHLKHCKAEPGQCPFVRRAAIAAANEDAILSERDFRITPGGNATHADLSFRESLAALDDAHRIYATSDLHATSLRDIDLSGHGIVIIGGDFISRPYEVAKPDLPRAQRPCRAQIDAMSVAFLRDTFLPWLSSHADKQFVIIPGNHDEFFRRYPDVVKWPDNAHFLLDSETEVNRLRIYGTPWCNGKNYETFDGTHEFLEEKFSHIPYGLDVLVSHAPPTIPGRNVDYSQRNAGHFGSPELTEAILEKKPRLVVCGHVHTGDHRPVSLGNTLVVNVSRVGTLRNRRAFAGRSIGFVKPESDDNEAKPDFLIDGNDGQQIDPSAYMPVDRATEALLADEFASPTSRRHGAHRAHGSRE